jgi:hypothetical protein
MNWAGSQCLFEIRISALFFAEQSETKKIKKQSMDIKFTFLVLKFMSIANFGGMLFASGRGLARSHVGN